MNNNTVLTMSRGLTAAMAAGWLLGGCATAEPVGALQITYTITGAVLDTRTLGHAADTAHLCSSAALPALHGASGGQPVEAPPGPPVYLVEFDPKAPAHKPGAIFKAFGVTAGAVTHSDPADDWIQINAKGRQWVGHGAQGAFHDSFTFAADGLSGRLEAHGLTAHRTDGTSVDLVATWRCPG